MPANNSLHPYRFYHSMQSMLSATAIRTDAVSQSLREEEDGIDPSGLVGGIVFNEKIKEVLRLNPHFIPTGFDADDIATHCEALYQSNDDFFEYGERITLIPEADSRRFMESDTLSLTMSDIPDIGHRYLHFDGLHTLKPSPDRYIDGAYLSANTHFTQKEVWITFTTRNTDQRLEQADVFPFLQESHVTLLLILENPSDRIADHLGTEKGFYEPYNEAEIHGWDGVLEQATRIVMGRIGAGPFSLDAE